MCHVSNPTQAMAFCFYTNNRKGLTLSLLPQQGINSRVDCLSSFGCQSDFKTVFLLISPQEKTIILLGCKEILGGGGERENGKTSEEKDNKGTGFRRSEDGIWLTLNLNFWRFQVAGKQEIRRDFHRWEKKLLE